MNTERTEQLFDMVYEEKSNEQSTSTQSKNSSNATLPNESPKRRKQPIRSLLDLGAKSPQRKGSNSCLDQFRIGGQEIQGRTTVYKVYYYDSQSDIKYEVAIQAESTKSILEFLQDVIREFNLQNEHIQPLLNDGSMQFELYMAKKKKGTPNLDFPSFAHNIELGKCGVQEFALKVECMSQEIVQQQGVNQKKKQNSIVKEQKKSFWEKFFFCCYNED